MPKIMDVDAEHNIMKEFERLFIENSHCLKIGIGDHNTKTESRIGGEVPDNFADSIKCPECSQKMKYFLTLANDVSTIFAGQKLKALSVFYCSDFDCLLKSNSLLSVRPSIIAINHQDRPRIQGENSMNAVFDGRKLSFQEMSSEETKDEESSIIGGKPTFIQDDDLHQKLLKQDYLFLFNFNEETVPRTLNYNEYIFSYGSFYVYAKKEKENMRVDLSDTKIYWQNS